jgi:hypothetical protein
MRTPPKRGDNTLTAIALILGLGVCLTLLLLFLTSLGNGPDAKISTDTPAASNPMGTTAPGAAPLGPAVNDRAGDN